MSDHRKHHEDQPRTASEEFLREFEDAENRTRDATDERRHRGEAADAITPNPHAQEESEGD